MLLRVDNVSVAYDAVEALKSLSLSVSGAEIVAVPGANGGKENHAPQSYLRPSAYKIWHHCL